MPKKKSIKIIKNYKNNDSTVEILYKIINLLIQESYEKCHAKK